MTERLDRARGFPWKLALITAVAFAFRVWYGRVVPGRVGGDAAFYHALANALADGKGFVDPFELSRFGRVRPSAFRLPLFPGTLGVFSELGLRSVAEQRLVAAALGSGTVMVVGLLGRRVGGARLGLIAAGVAAAYPNLWVMDGLLIVETMYGLVVATFLLCVYRWLDEPTTARAATLGIVAGLGALTRADMLIVFAVCAVPVIALHRSIDRRRRVRLLVVSGAALLVVLAPWTAYNSVRFERFVPLSTNSGVEFALANCDEAWSGPEAGFWTIDCVRPGATRDEAEFAARQLDAGLDHVFDNLGELPRVVVLRVGRVWDLYRPLQNIDNSALIDARDRSVTRYGQIVYYFALGFAGVGLVILGRRRVPRYPLVSMAIAVTAVAAISHGELRFRVPAEIAIVVLVGVALEAGLARLEGGATAHKEPNNLA